MHPTLCLLPALLLLSPEPSPLPSEEQVRAVRAAWIAERMGKTAEAQRLLLEATRTWPDDAYVLDERLGFLERTHLDPAAQATVREKLIAALSDPGRPFPLAVVRRQILDDGTGKQDLETLRTVVSGKLAAVPGDPQLLSLLADAQRRLQDVDGLSVTLDKLASVAPSHALDWERLIVAAHRRRWQEAKVLLDKVAAAGDEAALLAPLRLSVLAHLGDMDAVLAAAGEPKTREERAHLAGALQQVGWDLWDAGHDAQAEAVFRKAGSLVPENVAVGQIVAQLFSTAEERAARAQNVEASWSAVDNPSMLLQEGSSRLVAGDAAGAYPLLARASALLPEEPSAWYNLGLAAKKTERFDEAVSALQRALGLRPDWAPALRALADAQARSGACATAVITARHAAQVDPGNADPYVTLFNCLQIMGDAAGAEEAKREYEKRKGSSP
ncbi:MAG TPA: tetratricopeptide repeat protein [Candidatus Polarisedimenticolaceae bacterium]|nr:tetratricopeptide repeat protein [Candidatus Polarisedimenticolaceae bacterium]